ncbi:MAG: transcriptional repressor LexA [Anaerolineaceae bacterium]|nr:transcriptional repressor LexA [Anaerolineaceae bacterium]
MPRTSKVMEQRLEKIIKFIIQYSENNGYPPTIRDIGERINVSSTSQVSYYLNKLKEKQLITKNGHTSRSLLVTQQGYEFIGKFFSENNSQEKGHESLLQKVKNFSDSLWSIPVYGRIVASAPLPMPDDPNFEPDTTIDVARSIFGVSQNPDKLFALEVDGDSMIDAMINDGDTVIFHKQDTVNNGEMAAIWIDDDNSTTLKYFYKEQDHFRLRPANPTMKDIIIPKDKNLRIMGKVVAVVRQVSSI